MNQFKGPDGQEDMPFLLTTGPNTTSRDVKIAMLADWGANDTEFLTLLHSTIGRLKSLAGCDSSYECLLIPGSNANAIEAALGTFAPAKRKKTLIVANGPTDLLPQQMMQRIGRNYVVLGHDVVLPIEPETIAKALDEDRNISHVWLTHCDAASGFVNPLAEISNVVKSRDRILMVDVFATFGAVPIDMQASGIDAMVAGPNACLEAVPGFSFVFVRRDMLMAAQGVCHAMVLDVFEQWQSFEVSGQFRFSPSTHAISALQQALRELDLEGGVVGREKRYRSLSDAFRTRMRALGFSMMLPASEQSHTFQTVLAPADSNFNFKTFRDKLRARGFVIAEGASAGVECFRVGMMGQVNEKLLVQLVAAIEQVLSEMNVRSFAPNRT